MFFASNKITLVIALTSLLWVPCQTFCFPSGQATEIISRAKSGDLEGVLSALGEFEGSHSPREISLHEAKSMVQSFVDQINADYAMNLNVAGACQLIRQHFSSLHVLPAQMFDLFHTIQLFELEDQDLTEESVEQSRYISYGLYWPWEWNWFGLNKRSRHTHHTPKTTVCQQELMLPNKMAAGFMCAFAGALVCILPGGAGFGSGMILTGLGLALDGMANGEKPYYVNIPE